MDRLIKMLEEISLPYAYSHFAEGEEPPVPYVCYSVSSSDNFGADNMAYLKILNINLELYSDKKDLYTENLTEEILSSYDFFYQKYETWIDSEKLYQTVYQFEITGG